MSEVGGVSRRRALEDMVLDLERVRARLPESLFDGEAEEVLQEAYEVVRTHSPTPSWPVARPYSTLEARLLLLAKLARAIRVRMQMTRSLNISGVDYFTWKLDEVIVEARLAAGMHPHLPSYTGWSNANA